MTYQDRNACAVTVTRAFNNVNDGISPPRTAANQEYDGISMFQVLGATPGANSRLRKHMLKVID